MTKREVLDQASWIVSEDAKELDQWLNGNPAAPLRIRRTVMDQSLALHKLRKQIDELP